ncbi:hypothetical protein BGZ63DRAFT_251372 [Mariannaea sp. PMI_226]|nr:hypothetical protein BGZ63DRAFT_251372 [Mariannaea sp. PMI_226]
MPCAPPPLERRDLYLGFRALIHESRKFSSSGKYIILPSNKAKQKKIDQTCMNLSGQLIVRPPIDRSTKLGMPARHEMEPVSIRAANSNAFLNMSSCPSRRRSRAPIILCHQSGLVLNGTGCTNTTQYPAWLETVSRVGCVICLNNFFTLRGGD